VRTASAPASSANLGPGYDILALALDLRCRVAVEPSSEWVVTSADVPAPEQTVAMVRSVAGTEVPHRVQIDSAIPQAAGLGSSAALLAATAAAFRSRLDPTEVFEVAAAAEGHPDNVAAAVFGGLVAAGGGSPRRLVVHPSLHVVCAVPDEQLATVTARTVVPTEVSRDVAVRTSARLVMLIEGLRQADPACLQAALGDELHEAPRASLTTTPGELIEVALESGALYAAWSGAGPSVIAFCLEDHVDAVIAALEAGVGPSGAVIEPAIDREGVRIE
jgi:homoserine kinase